MSNLDWKREELRPHGVRLALRLDSFSDAPLESIAKFIGLNLSKEQKEPWDILMVEYWGEGRLLIYPGLVLSNNRSDDVTFDLTFTDIERHEAEFDMMDDENTADSLLDELLEALKCSFVKPLAAVINCPFMYRLYGEESI